MSKAIEVTKGFKFAHRGCDVVEFQAGDVIEEPSDELYEVATKNKWAKEAKAKPVAKENKAKPVAKENKDAGPAPENKSE